jgi:hypothetical protein
MAGMLFATPGPNFVGHQSIYQFVNADGADPGTVCGPAAVATVMANRGKIPKSLAGLQKIEKAYPPDVISGALGTSPNRVLRALKENDIRHRKVDGQKELEDALRRGAAAIALIQNTAGLAGLGDGAHWFVIFGCDANGVHVTNYGFPPFIAWAKFEPMWSAPVPAATGMGGRAIAC